MVFGDGNRFDVIESQLLLFMASCRAKDESSGHHHKGSVMR